jgi:penicillin-binding protein 1B
MSTEIDEPKPKRFWHKFTWIHWVVFSLLAVFALGALTVLSVGGWYYYKTRPVIEARLKQPLFANTAKIYAAPREVRPGQKLSRFIVTAELRAAGYTATGAANPSQLGTYAEGVNTVTVHPGPQSFHAPDSATIHFDSGVVASISDDKGQGLSSYELEPLLITGLSDDDNRTKRRLITYDEIPNNLVQAVLAIEDRRFFEHSGVNYWRLMQAGVKDILTGHKQQGGSTLTMQLARGFFLSPEKRVKRKIIEIVITFQLEHRFNKKQLFEMYANQINLGQRGSFSINGFGEASRVYLGKDVKQLDLADSALLAGMIQRPNYFNPYHHPDRTIERRNLVLDGMVETGAITKDQAEKAKAEPLHLSTQSVDASEAPYFVDLVHDQLVQKLGDRDFNSESLRIYTSLDPELQRVATTAVESTVHVVDEQVDKLHAHHKPGETWSYPQVALVALNPHTGQVLALVGGRNYGNSQLNHAMAKRPTGSIFKPFVFATAFADAVQGTNLPGSDKLFTPVTMLTDEETTYEVGDKEYTPHDYHGGFKGQVTAREALAHSINGATISLASLIGFDKVAAFARDSGIKSARGTPSVAIGTYDATPMEMAGAYTVFANGGLHIDPWLLASVRASNGDVITDYQPQTKQVLDLRAAYLTTSLLENVINTGTGAAVRQRGFTAPAAGKTGTSHDAWFAGYTSNLLCIVWVGNDDYTDIKLEGAHAAAPIWAEFMKKAVLLPQYSDTRSFSPPDGVEIIKIDKATNLLSDTTCPDGFEAAFLNGTAPTDTCDHPPDHRNILQKIFGIGKPDPNPAAKPEVKPALQQ